ncbi:MAG: hypothetical protein SFW67_06300, partial [Myxococcaceae bacterium]|nr:hypothetical protein [Myxococcaceae bacterium]
MGRPNPLASCVALALLTIGAARGEAPTPPATGATPSPPPADSLSARTEAAPRPTTSARFGADGPARAARDERWDASGEARLRFNQALPFGVDDVGTSGNQRTWLQ